MKGMERVDIKSMTLPELKASLAELGQPAYRAGQIYQWLHRKSAWDFSAMTNLSRPLRERLADHYEIAGAAIERKYVSQIDGTVKYLFRLNDGEYVESVLMQYRHGYSICVSTQVGCKMGCTFCATGLGGFKRNLTPSEILSQIQAAQEDNGIRISNVVLMGMGEPLDNYDNVLRFLELVSSEDGLNIGMRHISLSTCGLVDRIYDLMEKNYQLTLSVSLHAPNDDIRRRTMPVAKRWSIKELLDACRKYAETTKRRISFEYAMIDGVNDSDECAEELAERLKHMLCHINLIPVNRVEESGYQKSKAERLRRFINILEKHHLTVTVRRSLGSDINASCGQLRRKHQDKDGVTV